MARTTADVTWVTPTTKRAAPGKGKRNRLTDLRCAWKHATKEERLDFLRDLENTEVEKIDRTSGLFEITPFDEVSE